MQKYFFPPGKHTNFHQGHKGFKAKGHMVIKARGQENLKPIFCTFYSSVSPFHPLLRHNIPNITEPMEIANCVLLTIRDHTFEPWTSGLPSRPTSAETDSHRHLEHQGASGAGLGGPQVRRPKLGLGVASNEALCRSPPTQRLVLTEELRLAIQPLAGEGGAAGLISITNNFPLQSLEWIQRYPTNCVQGGIWQENIGRASIK